MKNWKVKWGKARHEAKKNWKWNQAKTTIKPLEHARKDRRECQRSKIKEQNLKF